MDLDSKVGKEMQALKTMGRKEPVDLRARFPGASDDALDLLQGLLCFDPSKRLTVEEALDHDFCGVSHQMKVAALVGDASCARRRACGCLWILSKSDTLLLGTLWPRG